jgi:glyoxylase-like metal-dependent hydrolase (beta-lactamase superfamily II)
VIEPFLAAEMNIERSLPDAAVLPAKALHAYPEHLMKTLGFGAMALAFAALGCSDDGDAQQTPMGALAEALGGQGDVAALEGLQLEGTGTRYIPHEGFAPEDEPTEANTFTRTVWIDLEQDRLRVDTARQIEFLFPGPQSYTDVVQGNLGASTQPFFGNPLGALSSDKVASIRRQEMLLTPQFLLRQIDADDLTMESDVTMEGETYNVYAWSGGPTPLMFYVNADSNELAMIQTMELDFYKRDVMVQVMFSDWQSSGNIKFPRSRRVIRDGLELFSEQLSTVTVNPEVDAGAFDFPAGVTPQFNEALYQRGLLSHQWYFLLDSLGLPFTGIDRAITPRAIATGVWQLQGGSHHSFLVEQADGLVLVDAPLYDDRGAALANYIDEQIPGKSIKYVVASHFHEDHVSGIRDVLGRNPEAELVVFESSQAAWREILNAPSTLKPDALAMNPRNVTIRTVGADGAELADADHPLSLFHIRTDHAADMLMVQERTSNTVFVVDIYSPGNAAQLGAGDFLRALTDNDIPQDTLKVVGGHGGETDTFAEVQAAANAAP